ncbi:crossover junction endodeoxyribonuclease RuvC [candidate division KSB1 bacterium]|nr:crossover junction endodeoxyribonuclease RuvC [candidate division KSB1 bacterium]
MIILGIDPGISITGYAVLELNVNQSNLMDYGYIRTDSSTSFPLRLKKIYDKLTQLIEENRPQALVVEDIFYAKNVRTAITLGHVRGVALLSAMNHGILTAEYAAREIKQSVTGNGAASKVQVQRMVEQLLRIDCSAMRSDVTDAIAVALCHWHRCKS